MTIRSRLNKAERVAAIRCRKANPPRVFVYYEGDEYGTLRGKDVQPQRVKVADYLANPGRDDTIMRVVYDDKKPISNITGPGGYTKTIIGLDLVEF